MISPDPHVRAHLLGVVSALRAVPHASSERQAALDRLEAYAQAGRFPRPSYSRHAERRVVPPRHFSGPGSRAPLFVDAAGTYCAVGHLLAHTRPDLVERIRREANDAWLLEMHVSELAEWAETQGLTVEELAWIQPSYHYELRTCEEMSISAGTPGEGVAYPDYCEGPDAGFGLGVAETLVCETCGGPFQVWGPLENDGTEDAIGITVRFVGASGETLDEMDGIDLPSGYGMWAGPFTFDGTLDELERTSVVATLADDCFPENNTIFTLSGPDYEGEVSEPAECEMAETSTPDESTGCGGNASALLLAAPLLRRRRRA